MKRERTTAFDFPIQFFKASVFAFVIMPTFAHAGQCTSLFEVENSHVISYSKNQSTQPVESQVLVENYKKRNEILSKRYPDLEFIFNDPESFVKKIRQRFEKQKRITPDDPRLFNFPEAAPTMKEIKADLENFRLDLVSELQIEKTKFGNKISHLLLNKRSEKVETITKIFKYIDKVQLDIDQMVDSGIYPYRETVYTLYYYSRIRGFFQFKELGPYHQVAKYVDMLMHGYRRLSADDEIRLYEARGNPIVQVRSGKISSEFRVAEIPYRAAFERKDQLEYIIIPSVHALGASSFLHVLPHDIHFIGATNSPIPADGFKRPGGLFWMHDVRHEADRYMKINAYRKAQNLTEKQNDKLKLYMHKWHSEFLELKNSIQDPELKASLDHYHFYTHHDIGVPLIPSLFLSRHKEGLWIYYTFLWHKNNAGEAPVFKNWKENTKKAQDILTEFWTERLQLEKQLLQKDPVQIKNWEDWFLKNY